MSIEALYLLKVVITLILFSVGAVIFVRYMRKNGHVNNSENVKIISSLRLSSRDNFFVLKCGNYVLAFVISANNGTRLLGKWTYDDWIKNNNHE